jgi:hypothetical protein
MIHLASKQQTTALVLPTIVTRTRRNTELTKELKTCWETRAVPENIQFSFSCSVFYTVNLQELCVLYIGRAYCYPPDVAFYIFFSTNITTEYLKNAAHFPLFL